MGKLLTTKQVAELKGCDYSHVCKAIRRGWIPAIRFGHAWMVDSDDAEAWAKPIPPVIGESDLRRMYLDERKTIAEVGEQVGVSDMVIHRLMKRFDVPRRSRGDYRINPYANKTPDEMEITRKRMSEKAKAQGRSPWGNMSPERREKRRKEASEDAHAKWGNGIFGSEEWTEKQRQTHEGEKCYRWKGGSDHYRGQNWQQQRRRARKHDNYTCQRCGITEKDLGQQLDVHHKRPYTSFTDYHDANQLDNLICYCKTCHAIEDHALNGNGKS